MLKKPQMSGHFKTSSGPQNCLRPQRVKGSKETKTPSPLHSALLGRGTCVGRSHGTPVRAIVVCQLACALWQDCAQLLFALASVKRVGDLQALSIDNPCIDFGPGDCRVTLKPRKGYVPKLLLTLFKAQVITLSALHPETYMSSAPDSSGSQDNYFFF